MGRGIIGLRNLLESGSVKYDNPRARIISLSGTKGSGKSTLTKDLAENLRNKGETVYEMLYNLSAAQYLTTAKKAYEQSLRDGAARDHFKEIRLYALIAGDAIKREIDPRISEECTIIINRGPEVTLARQYGRDVKLMNIIKIMYNSYLISDLSVILHCNDRNESLNRIKSRATIEDSEWAAAQRYISEDFENEKNAYRKLKAKKLIPARRILFIDTSLKNMNDLPNDLTEAERTINNKKRVLDQVLEKIS